MIIADKKTALEQQLAHIEKELKDIEKSAAYKKEITILRALNNLMKKHGCTKTDLVKLLKGENKSPSKGRQRSSVKASRKPRILKIFKNPNTGEIVETRGGNHRTLKAWKAEYRLNDIEDWLIGTRD